MSFDNSSPIAWFISLIKMIRIYLLERFIIPGLGISYWDFIIGLAIAAVVITVLINSVRIGIVSGFTLPSFGKKEKSEGAKASEFRSRSQSHPSSSVQSHHVPGGYRSNPPKTKSNSIPMNNGKRLKW